MQDLIALFAEPMIWAALAPLIGATFAAEGSTIFAWHARKGAR